MLGNCWVWLLFLDSGFVSTSTHSFTNSATNHMCQLHLTHHTPSKTLPSRVNHSSILLRSITSLRLCFVKTWALFSEWLDGFSASLTLPEWDSLWQLRELEEIFSNPDSHEADVQKPKDKYVLISLVLYQRPLTGLFVTRIREDWGGE